MFGTVYRERQETSVATNAPEGRMCNSAAWDAKAGSIQVRGFRSHGGTQNGWSIFLVENLMKIDLGVISGNHQSSVIFSSKFRPFI